MWSNASDRADEKAQIVLVAAKEDLLDNLKDALAGTQIALLHAETQQQAIALLESLKSEIALAIIELELSGGFDLIGQLTRPPRKPVKIIATTSIYSKPFLEKVKELGVDAVVPEEILPKAWRETVETVLANGEPLSP